MTEDKFAKDTKEMIESLPAEIKDASLGFDKATVVRATALMMAVKYADTATIKDGVMYQAKKAEGANLEKLTTFFVLRSAVDFERYLRGDYSAMADELVGGDFEAWLKHQVQIQTDRLSEDGHRIFKEKDGDRD